MAVRWDLAVEAVQESTCLTASLTQHFSSLGAWKKVFGTRQLELALRICGTPEFAGSLNESCAPRVFLKSLASSDSRPFYFQEGIQTVIL